MASALYDKLMEDMKAAMKAHDMKAVNAVRSVIAKVKDLLSLPLHFSKSAV